MLAIDEDLRYGRAPVGASDHLVAPRRFFDNIDFVIRDALRSNSARARAQYGQNIVV